MNKGVIFGLENVIVNTDDLYDSAICKTLTKRGHPELIEIYTREDLGQFSLQYRLDVLCNIAELDKDRTYRLIEECILSEIDKIEVDPRKTTLLSALALYARKIGVCSEISAHIVEMIIDRMDLGLYINTITGRDQATPRTELYTKTATLLGIKPEECIVIEGTNFGELAARKFNPEKLIRVSSASEVGKNLLRGIVE